MAELNDEPGTVQRETVSAAAIQCAVAFLDPVWGMLLVPERFRILHLLLAPESVVYDGATGDLKLAPGRGIARPMPPPHRCRCGRA
jgi:hypothetical protein